MKALLLTFLTILSSGSALAATGYVCGNTDGTAKFMLKSTNLKLLKSQVMRACRSKSESPQLCGPPFCQSYVLDPNLPQGGRRRQGRVRAPREDQCDSICWAQRGIDSAERQRREREIDEILRERRGQR